jgi:hypothetical protein
MNTKKMKFWSLFCILAVLTTWIWSTTRTIPLDVYIIVDGSSAMEKGREEAVSWLCSTVVDGILQPEDRIWIWRAGAKPELIYSGTLGADKERVKTQIRSIQFQGEAADYRGALGEAQALVSSQSRNRISYTLLVSGSGAKDPPSQEAESAGLLRYSRVDSFSGWRVLTVGLDLNARVRQSTTYYMNNQ